MLITYAVMTDMADLDGTDIPAYSLWRAPTSPSATHLCSCPFQEQGSSSLCLIVLLLMWVMRYDGLGSHTAGASVLIVNGMLMDLQNFELYSLVDTIRKEVPPTRPPAQSM